MLHFLFLRAINTGSRRLTNDDLIAPLGDAGFEDVAAFQAAGNVAFRTADDTTLDAGSIEQLLTNAFGFDAPVFVRSEHELRSVVERCPFDRPGSTSGPGKPQVTFMRTPVGTQLVAEVASVTPEEDLVAFDGAEWFWLPAHGVSTSKLPVPAIERIVGPMTMRTLGTLERMLKKFAG